MTMQTRRFAIPIRASLFACLGVGGMASFAQADPTSGWPLHSLPYLMPSSPPIHSVRGASAGDRFGASVAAVGDVDADGVGDWAVGAPRAGSSLPFAGSVRVFSGRDGSELLTLEGDSASDAFGTAIAAVGDVNADGHADILVGAPRGMPTSGSAEVRSGLDGSVLWTFVGRAAGDQFGAAVAGLGDVNGDGVPDSAVGAPYSDAGGSNSGELAIHSGADGSAILRIAGGAWDQLGRSVAGAGDVDGDGRGDVVVGVPFSDVGAFNGGSMYVLSGADGRRLVTVHGTGIGDQLGFSVAGGVDVNLDGVPDLLCSVPAADVGGWIDAGAAQLHSGKDGSLLLRISGRASSEYLSAVSFQADVNGDGQSELLVGAAGASAGASEAGRVRLVSGADGHDLQVLAGVSARNWFGASVAGLGDLNADGRPDFVVGAPGHDDELEIWGYARVMASNLPVDPSGGGRR